MFWVRNRMEWNGLFFLTNPSQLLIATVASGMPVMPPVNTHSCFKGSRKTSWKSSCHSAKAPGDTSLWLGFKWRWNSLPQTVTLKKYKGFQEMAFFVGMLRTVLCRAECCAGAGESDTTCDRNRPWWSTLKGTITSYSRSFPDRISSMEINANRQSSTHSNETTFVCEKKPFFPQNIYTCNLSNMESFFINYSKF